MTGNLPTRIMLLRFIITISACRSDSEILGPQSQYLPKIVSIFAEVMHGHYFTLFSYISM